MNWLIYTKDNCPWCVKAKEFLQKNGYRYIEKWLPDFKDELLNRLPSTKTVPQIFFHDHPVGGYTDLIVWDIRNFKVDYVELKKSLYESVVEILYQKDHDEYRNVVATLDSKRFSYEYKTADPNPSEVIENPTRINVWDIEKDAWRTLSLHKIKKVFVHDRDYQLPSRS